MSKQDRQGVRTAREIEIKYNLGRLKKAAQEYSSDDIVLNQLIQTMNQYMATMNAIIEELRESIRENNSAIEKLAIRVTNLESGTTSSTSAILDSAILDSMILE